MIVVDTNIISYFYLNSDFSLLAEQTFKKDSEWASPLLWRSEFRNVLIFYIRNKIITLEESIDIFENVQELLKDNEYEIVSAQVLQLSSVSDCSAYDCEFVTLAKDLNTMLLTEDKKIIKSFPETAISMKEFLKK